MFGQAPRGHALRVAVVLGTRPEAIKLAPVIRALEGSSIARPTVISTGQHREAVREALGLFGIEAELELDAMGRGRRAADRLGQATSALSAVLRPSAFELVRIVVASTFRRSEFVVEGGVSWLAL